MALEDEFEIELEHPDGVRGWELSIFGSEERPLRTFRGDSAPPSSVVWDGTTDGGHPIEPGQVYVYQFVITHADGTRAGSTRPASVC